jgi:hypothetical protein
MKTEQTREQVSRLSFQSLHQRGLDEAERIA